MYCTVQEVYDATKLTTSEVDTGAVKAAIIAAEKRLDRKTFTTYWNVEDSGTATAGGATTLTDTGQFNNDDFTTRSHYVWIYGGTGSGQVRKIISHDDDTLTVATWTTNPDTDSTYRVIYTATDPYYNSGDEILLDGDGAKVMFLDEYPIRLLESLKIDATTVTTTEVFKWPKTGKLELKSTAETTVFSDRTPQLIDIDYWWGVYPFDELAKRYVIVTAGLMTLATQMGGTHNIPSTYAFPEGSVTIGQAYINIKTTWDVLAREHIMLEKDLIRYPKIV